MPDKTQTAQEIGQDLDALQQLAEDMLDQIAETRAAIAQFFIMR